MESDSATPVERRHLRALDQRRAQELVIFKKAIGIFSQTNGPWGLHYTTRDAAPITTFEHYKRRYGTCQLRVALREKGCRVSRQPCARRQAS
jgi:hypothetical protein